MKAERCEGVDRTAAASGLGNRAKLCLSDVKGHLIFWPTFLFGLVLDLWTKRAVFAWLENEPSQSAEIIKGFLTFRLGLNSGAAFGIAQDRYWFLVGVSSLAMLIIIGVFLFSRAQHRVVQAALGLFAAGVSGNLWDRIFNGGRVRDFIDVVYWPGRHWHTFNVADALLCVAVGLLILATLLTDSSSRRHAPPQK